MLPPAIESFAFQPSQNLAAHSGEQTTTGPDSRVKPEESAAVVPPASSRVKLEESAAIVPPASSRAKLEGNATPPTATSAAGVPPASPLAPSPPRSSAKKPRGRRPPPLSPAVESTSFGAVLDSELVRLLDECDEHDGGGDGGEGGTAADDRDGIARTRRRRRRPTPPHTLILGSHPSTASHDAGRCELSCRTASAAFPYPRRPFQSMTTASPGGSEQNPFGVTPSIAAAVLLPALEQLACHTPIWRDRLRMQLACHNARMARPAARAGITRGARMPSGGSPQTPSALCSASTTLWMTPTRAAPVRARRPATVLGARRGAEKRCGRSSRRRISLRTFGTAPLRYRTAVAPRATRAAEAAVRPRLRRSGTCRSWRRSRAPALRCGTWSGGAGASQRARARRRSPHGPCAPSLLRWLPKEEEPECVEGRGAAQRDAAPLCLVRRNPAASRSPRPAPRFLTVRRLAAVSAPRNPTPRRRRRAGSLDASIERSSEEPNDVRALVEAFPTIRRICFASGPPPPFPAPLHSGSSAPAEPALFGCMPLPSSRAALSLPPRREHRDALRSPSPRVAEAGPSRL